MWIREIMEIQKKCRKQARLLAREAYAKYDAIWTDGIRITEELAKMNVIGEINRKMPNLLLRDKEKPEIGEIAARYGFADAGAVVDYLLAYQPRGRAEERIYRELVQSEMAEAPAAERELAVNCGPGQLAATLRSCREMARDIRDRTYEKYDEIWSGKIRITPELQKHGSDVICEINRKMPNMLTHNPNCSPIDHVAMEYDFDCVQELVDWLLAYEPRTGFLENTCEGLARQELGLADEQSETDEVPF